MKNPTSSDGTTSLVATIGCATIPPLVLIMLSVTGVAVVLGWISLARAGLAGSEVLHACFWIIFWTGLSEGVALVVGILAILRLARRIARPISDLAAQAETATMSDSEQTFRTDSPIREVNLLSAAFNRLFEARTRRIREIRELSSHILHDIKTPLARIHALAELSFRGKADAAESIRRIAEECGTILGLVNLNAEISRTYAGADLEPARDVDVAGLIRNAADLYAGIAEEKDIRMSLDLPDGKLLFKGHPHRLQGLVANLLDNALKYTNNGGSVDFSAIMSNSPDPRLVLRIADSGIGIPPEAQPRIFERFFRADASRHAPGFGLGLALVHAVVTSYNGTVACESTPGRGTVFTVVLPVVP